LVRLPRFHLTASSAAVVAGLVSCTVAAAGTSNVSDGSIRARLPDGWHASVAPGVQAGRRVAWILLADFPLAADAATLEGGPSVPRHKVLVAVGDFVPVGIAADGRRVNSVVLPAANRSRHVSWNVRFAGRALRLSVSFGSTPTNHTRQAVERVLASIKHA
jgi:hypothetical protein